MRAEPASAPVSDAADGALRLGEHGAEHYRAAAAADLPALCNWLSRLPADRAGTRIGAEHGIADLLGADRSIGRIAAAALGPNSRPVRAILFNKTAQTNWSLGWHQDRTICVRERIAVAGFGPWTIKAGMPHVAPPFAILARMVTLRIHLDDVPADNAPLLIAPGSHQAGLVAEEAIEEVVRRCGTHACLAAAGDLWLYATPILHASQAAAGARSRRVLQIDFAAGELPGGLAWRGL